MIGPRFGRRTVGVIVASWLALTAGSAAPITAAASPPARPAAPAAPARPVATTTAAQPVIVIDPGHSGRSIRSRNAGTGLIDFDYPNYPELYEVFGISTCIAVDLRKIGYRVIMTKATATSSVSLSRRAQIANQAGADLAVSVHDDHTQTYGFQAVYSQRGVKHNGVYHRMWRGSGWNYTVFNHPLVARRSERATRLIAQARATAQNRPVRITEENFTGRAGLEPGNLALVQLLSRVPWVYSEAGANNHGSTTRWMSLDARTGYAKGLLRGIVAAVPLAGARAESGAAMRRCLINHPSG